MRPADAPAVRRAFRSALTPRDRVGWDVPAPEVLDAYEALSLDWFLEGRSLSRVAVLHDDHHALCGFALVCVAPETFEAWRRAALVRYLQRVTPLLVGRLTGDTARFILLRALDNVTPWRRPVAGTADLPSARLFVSRGTSCLAAVDALTGFVDDACRAGGFDRWVGEIDGAPIEIATLDELGIGTDSVAYRPSRMMSWLRGDDTERLSFTRSVPAATDADATMEIAWIGANAVEATQAQPA